MIARICQMRLWHKTNHRLSHRARVLATAPHAAGRAQRASASPLLPETMPRAVRFRGYIAGILAGATYGLNPLFGLPLMQDGMSVVSVLFYRYIFSTIVLGLWLVIRRQNFRIDAPQAGRLGVMGSLYAASSILLFVSYHDIPSGIGTTLVFLYPVMVALIMVFLKVCPKWQTWVAIFVTFLGVALLSLPEPGAQYRPIGFVLAALSALAYAFFVVMLNQCKPIRQMTNSMVTFYALCAGSLIFLLYGLSEGLAPIPDVWSFFMLLGLAIFPTIVSTATFSYAARLIGPTQTSVLGVFEPITALAVGILVFGEPLSLTILVGMILALSAIAFMTATTNRS